MNGQNLRRESAPVMPTAGEWKVAEDLFDIEGCVVINVVRTTNNDRVHGVFLGSGPFLNNEDQANVACVLRASELLKMMVAIERFVSSILSTNAALLDTATLAILHQVHMIASHQVERATPVRVTSSDAKGGAS